MKNVQLQKVVVLMRATIIGVVESTQVAVSTLSISVMVTSATTIRTATTTAVS